MSLLSHMVVGVDGSAGSQLAFEWAITQAEHGEVTAVHAFPTLTSLFAAAVLVNLDPARAEHKKLLEGDWIAAATGTGTTVHPVLVEDNPASALRSVSKRHGNLPIVIGHQGHGWRHRHHVGDVASQLLHRAELPLVMTTDATEAKPIEGTVAVCVQGPATASHEPVAWAAALAAERSLTLHIVSVSELPVSSGRHGYSTEIDLTAVHEANVDSTNALVDELQSENPDMTVTSETRQGHPTLVLGEAISELSPAVVVIGNHHHTKLASIVTDSVSRHLPAYVDCPVIAVPTK